MTTKKKMPGRTKRTELSRDGSLREPPLPLEPLWQDAEELRWAARHWATRVGVRLTRLQLRQMTSKWASISTAGRLTLNTDLLRLPKDLGEFVIVHELVHLLAPNHGRVFKSFMHAYLPDWPEREARLRGYGESQPAQQRAAKGRRKAMRLAEPKSVPSVPSRAGSVLPAK